jgi:hypothetical protein
MPCAQIVAQLEQLPEDPAIRLGGTCNGTGRQVDEAVGDLLCALYKPNVSSTQLA